MKSDVELLIIINGPLTHSPLEVELACELLAFRNGVGRLQERIDRESRYIKRRCVPCQGRGWMELKCMPVMICGHCDGSGVNDWHPAEHGWPSKSA